MGMPRKPLQVVLRIIVAEVIQQQERIEVLGFPEAKGALQFYARAFHRRLGLNYFFYWSNRSDILFPFSR